jgi:hypothetical protein
VGYVFFSYIVLVFRLRVPLQAICYLYLVLRGVIKYMINRLNTYPMEKNDKNTGKNIIKYILRQNQYQINESLKQKLNSTTCNT